MAPVAVALALACRLALNPALGNDSPFMYFFVAIIVSGWLGGLGPGLLATVLSALAVDYFYLPPTGLVLQGNPKEIIQIVSFGILGAVVSAIVARMKREQRRAEEAADVARANEAEAQRAEEALHQSEKRFEAFMHHLPGAAWMKDLHGRYIWINPEAERIFARSLSELQGKTDEEIFPPETARHFRENDQRALNEDGIVTTTEVMRQSDGIDHYSLVNKFAVPGPDGRPACVGGVAFDITERKRTEERLRDSERRLTDIIEFLPDATFALDKAGRIIAWNKAMEDLTGAPAREVLGMGNYEYTYRLYGRRIPCLADKVLTGNQPEWSYSNIVQEQDVVKAETYIPRLKGGVWLAIKVAPIYDVQGNIAGVIDACRDITEGKRAAEALGLANERLLEADRRKDEFLAMLAHELRNPLAPIRYAVQMLNMSGVTQEQINKQHEVIDRQVSHMGRLLEDLLEVSRITRGKITLKREIVDLRTVAAQALDSLRPMIEGRGQHLLYEEPSSPLPVNGDPTRLEQIIRNLLHNANKFTETDGCIKLSLGLEIEQVHGRAVVRISDSGIGITPEMLPRVFEAFVQAEQSLDRTQGGLGIGLAMVRNLVQMHGGSVEAHSAGAGRGSEFVVRLPLAAAGVDVLKEEAAASEGPETAPPPRPRRVLVVEDNEDAAASLGELLGLWGHEVRTTHDGRHALAVAHRWHPEIILLDIGLPGMDGYEVARHLREDPANAGAYLVALTGYGQDEDRRRAREAGFDQHLTKPAELGQLQEIFRKIHVG